MRQTIAAANFFDIRISSLSLCADRIGFVADWLSSWLVTAFVDATGLTGTFDLRMVWVGAALIDQGGLTIFDALEKQLGLKLEARKHSMPVTVIDHIEKLAEAN